MISDNFLLKLLDSTQPLEKGTLGEMATELLAYREAARQASSWDDAPTWAVSRRPIPQRVKWV